MILLLLLSYHDTGRFPVRHIERLERNHLLDSETGETVFTQIIAWRKYGDAGEHVSWFKIDTGQVTILPCRGSWLATFFVDDEIRVYKSREYIETWTHSDPEMEDRQLLPKEERW